MEHSAECEYLEWDSEFFRRRIARVTLSRIDETLADRIENWCSEQAIECLYFLADSSDVETIRLAQRRGFRFVDTKVTFEYGLDRAGERVTTQFTLRSAKESDIAALRKLARVAHTDSRFYYDGNFPVDRCNALYETWIEKSCGGWADKVFVGDIFGTAEAYLTCHQASSGSGRIGLVGVSEKARGKGLGTALVSHAVRWFQQEGVENIRVVTQSRNLAAQRLYQKCGFVPISTEIWFHRWFSEKEEIQ
jgi:dTDP-4-amino-4,6-dideoxy-D-galactose acyltransferase